MRSRNMFSEEFFSANGVRDTPELEPSSPVLTDPITETPVATTLEPDDQVTTAPVTLVEETTELVDTIRPPSTYYQNMNLYYGTNPGNDGTFYPTVDSDDSANFWSGAVSGGGAIDDKSLEEITDEAENGSPTSNKKRILWMVLVGVALVVAYKYYRKNN